MLTFQSRRSPVLGRRGMVAASQPLASQAGLDMLMQGGTAADAAIAIAAVLNVTEPYSTGLGGDCFALYYEAASGNVTALNGSGRAAAGLSLELLARQGISALPPLHAHTVTVPGACAGWCDLIERYGSLPLKTILASAIYLAEEGFPVAPITSYYWQELAEQKLRFTPGGSALTIDGRGPRPGEIFRNPDLARTFQVIAEGGKKAFYEGDTGQRIVKALQAAGSAITMDDLAGHLSSWDEPISTVYRGMRVWECPPNGQGLAALLALNILEGFDLSSMSPESPQRWHLLVEAMHLAFADTSWYVADPKFFDIPLEALLSKGYAAERRNLLDPLRASLDAQKGAPVASSDTVYFCVVDGKGNACSFINSVFMGFGSGIVAPGTGFALQNRGFSFSLDPAHPNALLPNKRPYHTIIPAMLTRETDGSLYAPFGVMGDFMQPQGQVQVVVGMLDDQLDPQAAVDRPRFRIDSAQASGKLMLETGIPAQVASVLAQQGHFLIPDVTGSLRNKFGLGQIIRRDPSGVLWGGSDPRIDGCAMGF